MLNGLSLSALNGIVASMGPNMNEEFSNADLSQFVFRMAASIGATEAFAFGIRAEGEDDRFPLLVHIRPDDSPEQVRRKARETFIEIAQPCIQTGRDGAIELSSGGMEDPILDPQFCLVCRARFPAPMSFRSTLRSG